MNIEEILKAARKRIEKPENWYYGQSDSFNYQYCAALSIIAEAKFGYEEPLKFFAEANGLGGFAYLTNVYEWNDAHTHAEVLAGFDKAIALASVEN